MDINIFQTLIEKTVKDYNNIHFLWHGGEPLLAGINFYENIIKIEKKYSTKIIISNSMQSNGTLLTSKFANLLLDNGFQIGFSFDGQSNEINRGLTCETLRSMELIRKTGRRVCAIKVVLNEDMLNENIIAIYEYFKEKEIDLKLNPIFKCEIIKPESLLSPHAYTDNIIKLFNVWVNDVNCHIKVDPIENYLSLFRGKHRDCSNASCLTRFLSVDYIGNVYPCSRYYNSEYCYGNIMTYSSIKDAYQSEGFKNVLISAIERRNFCINNCIYFSACQGGCNHDAMIEGKLTENGFFSCLVFKRLYSFFNEAIENGILEKSKNPRAKQFL